MKTLVHVSLILMIGVSLGLAMRFIMNRSSGTLPNETETVYTNDAAIDGLTEEEIASIANTDISRPPDSEDWLSRFELTERSGELVSSEDLLGSPYIVSFFFSTCPSICVQQNQKIKELQEQFSGEGVRFVAISVDPEKDTPEQLTEYAARFNADPQQWLLLTGDFT